MESHCQHVEQLVLKSTLSCSKILTENTKLIILCQTFCEQLVFIDMSGDLKTPGTHTHTHTHTSQA